MIERGQPALVVAADDCPGEGRLATRPACRATTIDALAGTGAVLVRTERDGLARTYADGAVGLLRAAARFAERVRPHDAALADRARREPVVAARRATGRAGPVGRLVAETGLAAYAEVGDCAVASSGHGVASPTADLAEPTANLAESTPDSAEPTSEERAPCTAVLRPDRAPTVALGRVRPHLPERVRLRDRWELDTGSVVRRYATEDARDLLHLRPVSATFDDDDRRTLAAAYERLASGRLSAGGPASDRALPAVDGRTTGGRSTGGYSTDDRSTSGRTPDERTDPTPGRAVRAVADTPDPRLTETLRRHTRGLGYVAELLAVPGATDATCAAETPVRVAVDGERLTTNVRLSPSDAATLASRVRATSGRGLSRADPTGHATLDGVRVAAVTRPATDGPRFTLRATRDETAWTLPRLVAAGTLPDRAAATLSLAVERGVAALIAGPRGAGKTTLLAAVVAALPPTVPSVVIEDTPELPVARLRDAGREVTHLAVGDDAPLTATEAVRTALRLGDGALIVGEVRGTEAQALYEAMRVGSAADATLGTIHGDGPVAVRERVVSDLGVPESAFAATDLVVTLDADHRLATLDEVRGRESVSFASLFDRSTDPVGASAEPRSTVVEESDAGGPDAADPATDDRVASATGVIDRGESHLLDDLAGPDETYADVRETLAARTERLRRLAAAGITDLGAIHETGGDGD